MELKNLLGNLMSEVRKVSDAATMIGEPLQIGNTHMVPLLRVTIGFGTGVTSASGSGSKGRDGQGAAGGAGGGMIVEPRAFVMVGGDGIPQLVALKDGKYGVVQKALELRQDDKKP